MITQGVLRHIVPRQENYAANCGGCQIGNATFLTEEGINAEICSVL